MLNRRTIKTKTKELLTQIEERFKSTVCGDVPNAFWNRKYIVTFPYKIILMKRIFLQG